MTHWTYEGYWNTVIGNRRSARTVVGEFDLDPDDRVGLDEWLGQAEAEAVAACSGGEGWAEGHTPAEWAAHHATALAELAAVVPLTECAYCGMDVEDEEPVPALGDDAAWSRLAKTHGAGCEWVATRAHRAEVAS